MKVTLSAAGTIAIALCLLSCGLADDGEPWRAPRDGVLLLRSGATLRGRITWAGDHYYVGVDQGRIGVRTSDVEMVCRDLEEGYRRRRASFARPSIADHQELARWCLRHELAGSAARELAAAAARDPTDAVTQALMRRLAVLRDQQAKRDSPKSSPEPGRTVGRPFQAVSPLSPHTIGSPGAKAPTSRTRSRRIAKENATRPAGTAGPAGPDPFDPAPFNRRFFPDR